MKIEQNGSSPINATPFQDTPVLAAKRIAFDHPTQVNLDKLIETVRSEVSADHAAEVERLKIRGDCHAETLRGIAAMDPSIEAGRMKQWARDGLSGYMETTEATVKRLSDEINTLTAVNAALREKVRLSRQETAAIKASVVHEVGGVCHEGFPTSEINYLQRLRILVEKEKERERFFWELGQIAMTIEGGGKIEGAGWSEAHKAVEALTAANAALREANAILQSQVDNSDVNFEQLRMVHRSNEKKLADENAALQSKVAEVRPKTTEYLVELELAEKEAEKWKQEGDMHGWNYHQGRVSGIITGDILFNSIRTENSALREEVKLLQFQSSLNDTDLPDAELVAALYDTLLGVTDDIDSPGSGTILSKVQCIVRQWTEDLADLTTARARIAELEKGWKGATIKMGEQAKEIEALQQRLNSEQPTCAHCRGEIGVILTTVADKDRGERAIARIAELEGVLRAMLAIHPMHSLSDDTLLETARRGPNEDIRIKARLVGKARAALSRTSEEGK